MSQLTTDRFAEFFKAVHGYEPFPWQKRVAKRVCKGDWPRAIALPTAAGKTACLDIAVFSLACNPKASPRRIFFVVDRRIVVDQALEHARKIAKVLKSPNAEIVELVAKSLLDIGLGDCEKDASPLDCYALRGGIYKETAWIRSPHQPTIITSTVDQVGSRLLFRGYGVSDSMLPVHAGLVGNDSVILLDEAHCSKPFDQTMQAIEHFRSWSPTPTPFKFVTITATPTDEIPADQIEKDNDQDRSDKVLGLRIKASKPAKLVVAEKAKGKNGIAELAKVIQQQAEELSGKGNACVGIIVNRVATARLLKSKLGDEAVLLTGRMRPIDRDQLYEDQLKPLLSNAAEGKLPKYVIGTQCLEVGADFDFHALVSECASLDALRQRFGRLNRVANRSTAEAVIVIRGDQAEDSEEDPIYGKSLSNTWGWMKSKAVEDVFDFGISAIRKTMAVSQVDELNPKPVDAPVLFPTHLDCWIQTNPKPFPDPDTAIFLHGPKSGQPDVQVVFRNDLGTDDTKWIEIVSLCPPSSSETMPVPISVFKKWMMDELVSDNTGDVEGEKDEEVPETKNNLMQKALRWRGPEQSEVVSNADDIWAKCVYVVPCQAIAVNLLGDFPKPEQPPEDHSEQAYQKSRDRAFLRLQCTVDENTEDFEDQITLAINNRELDHSPNWLKRAVNELSNKRWRESDKHPIEGWVITGKKRLHLYDPTFLEDDDSWKTSYRREITLIDHSNGVAKYARRFAMACGLDGDLYSQAGLLHDIGKLDRRFQAMLKGTSPKTTVGVPWAKSSRNPRTKAERDAERLIHGFPSGARHELLSTAMVASQSDNDLLLHLLATHHGFARPLALPVDEDLSILNPLVESDIAVQFKFNSATQTIAAWNATLPERFWRVVREYGWWGTVYREAIFRLADQAQSRAEQEEKDRVPNEKAISTFALARNTKTNQQFILPLPGLDGSNPLAYLAALGTLNICDQWSKMAEHPQWLNSSPAMTWGHEKSETIPVLHFVATPPSPNEFAEALAEQLPADVEKHSMAWAFQMLQSKKEKDYIQVVSRIRQSCMKPEPGDLNRLRWVMSLNSEMAPEASSQLQVVRNDYLLLNLKSVLNRCTQEHLFRSMFNTWDYADGLDNQSLHWEPTEDRRHAYQWNTPSGDPTRKRNGGMLGANRLALEAWPLFPAFPVGEKLQTVGFTGTRANDIYWTWPLWSSPLTRLSIASLLAQNCLRNLEPASSSLRSYGVSSAFRSQRILVGKTPNLTQSVAVG